jgi:hypothetical protein
MKLSSKIDLDKFIYIEFILLNNKLEFKLINISEDMEELNEVKIFLYKKINAPDFNYNTYHEIITSPLLKNKKLDEGNYLFMYNTTQLFVEFTGNKITFKLEYIEIDDDIEIDNIDEVDDFEGGKKRKLNEDTEV